MPIGEGFVMICESDTRFRHNYYHFIVTDRLWRALVAFVDVYDTLKIFRNFNVYSLGRLFA